MEINWRQEFNKLLRAYIATPQLMTKMCPASFGFNLGNTYTNQKTVLVYDKEVRKNDKINKQMMKQRADSKLRD